MLRMQQRPIDMIKRHQANTAEKLQQLFISPREIERAVQQHISGGNEAYELMRLGQEVAFFRHSGIRVSTEFCSNSVLYSFVMRLPVRLRHSLVMVGISTNLLPAPAPHLPSRLYRTSSSKRCSTFIDLLTFHPLYLS